MSRIARVRQCSASELSSPSAQGLLDELVKVVQASFAGVDSEIITQRVILRDPSSQCLLFFGSDDTLVGFSTYAVVHQRVAGRPAGVLDGGVYFKRGARGIGLWGALYVLLGGLAFKARHPSKRLYLLGIATNPASYRMVSRAFPSLQPRPGVRPPAWITSLVREMMSARGWESVDDDPWRVHVGFPVTLRREERMRAFVARSRDDGVKFFIERNPGYLEGHWLVVFIPLTLRESTIGLSRLVAEAVRRSVDLGGGQ